MQGFGCTAKRAPVIIVPGCYGSKFNVIEKLTGKKLDRAWFHQKFFPKIMQGEAAIRYLWGTSSHGSVTSFVEEFADIDVERGNHGIDGCDRFFESKVLDLVNGYYLAYMSPVVNFLKASGYELGKDLFCFTYDWRCAIYSERVLSSMRSYFEDVVGKLGGERPMLWTHSGGLGYILGFMRVYSDYERLFRGIISVNSPGDGCGSYSQITGISGYNLRMPFENISMKGCETFTAGMYGYLNRPPSKEIGPDAFQSAIFIRKLRTGLHRSRQVASHIGEGAASRSGSSKKINEPCVVFPEGCIPNAAALLMLQVSRAPQMQHKAGTLRLLAKGVPDKFLTESFRSALNLEAKTTKKLPTCEELLTPNYESPDALPNEEELKDNQWYWEKITTFAAERTAGKPLFIGDNGEPTGPFAEKIANGFKNIFMGQPGSEDLYHIAQARTFYQASRQTETLSQTKLAPPEKNYHYCGETPEQTDCKTVSQDAAIRTAAPWAEGSLSARDMFDLLERIYKHPSADKLLFGPSKEEYAEYDAFIRRPVFPASPAFKHYTIASCGQDTPVHAVYEKPVADYAELLIQRPTFVFADGDGLCPLYSSMTPVLPPANRGPSFIVPGVGHFPAVQDARVHSITLRILSGSFE